MRTSRPNSMLTFCKSKLSRISLTSEQVVQELVVADVDSYSDGRHHFGLFVFLNGVVEHPKVKFAAVEVGWFVRGVPQESSHFRGVAFAY